LEIKLIILKFAFFIPLCYYTKARKEGRYNMNVTEYKLMTEELKKEFTDNKKKVQINEEKAELVRLNSLEHQAMRTFGFSLIPYISLVVATCANDNFAAMTGATISGEFLPSVFMLSSLGIGTVINKIFKQNSKKRALFESFSEAKTDTEKIYEIVKYTIEQEYEYSTSV
jgi:hypothetical protein